MRTEQFRVVQSCFDGEVIFERDLAAHVRFPQSNRTSVSMLSSDVASSRQHRDAAGKRPASRKTGGQLHALCGVMPRQMRQRPARQSRSFSAQAAAKVGSTGLTARKSYGNGLVG